MRNPVRRQIRRPINRGPRTVVLPYRAGSRGATALAAALGCRVLRLEGSQYRYRDGDTVINWGNKDAHRLFPQALNSSTEEATDKLRFFRALQGSDITPAFWTNADEIPNDAFPIVCRTILNGHSGRGIVIADSRDQLVRAPLYTQYVKKQAEFRIHLGRRGNEYVTIAEQRKVRDPNVEVTDWRIRNHDSGFIFQRQGIEVPASVRDVARLCIEALRLDFGAVDVIYNVRQRRAYVLEINTAPGLEGQTVEDYASFFRSL